MLSELALIFQQVRKSSAATMPRGTVTQNAPLHQIASA